MFYLPESAAQMCCFFALETSSLPQSVVIATNEQQEDQLRCVPVPGGPLSEQQLQRAPVGGRSETVVSAELDMNNSANEMRRVEGMSTQAELKGRSDHAVLNRCETAVGTGLGISTIVNFINSEMALNRCGTVVGTEPDMNLTVSDEASFGPKLWYAQREEWLGAAECASTSSLPQKGRLSKDSPKTYSPRALEINRKNVRACLKQIKPPYDTALNLPLSQVVKLSNEIWLREPG